MNAALLLLGLLLHPGPGQAATLKPFVRGSWTELQQSHRGKPVIVHFWGLSCAPCLAELPQWGELLRDHPGLDLVTVAADPVPEDPNRIRATLERDGLAPADDWIFADTFLERLHFEVDPDWAGELPFNVLIASDGKATSKAGTVDFAAIRSWLDGQTRGSGGR
jgi:thiol-disulfide isomerase/thioredoxin